MIGRLIGGLSKWSPNPLSSVLIRGRLDTDRGGGQACKGWNEASIVTMTAMEKAKNGSSPRVL